MGDVILSSNWAVDEDRLSKIVTCCSNENKECDLENLTAENCICLTQEDNESSVSKPELEIKAKSLIKKIDIFSEGSMIEVFGIHNEYLFTCESDFIDDWEGLAVYHAQIVLPGIPNCKLKFTRTKDKNRLWLYSVQLSTIFRPEVSMNWKKFNFENVNNLINNSSKQISPKAEEFKSLFQLYLNNSFQSENFSDWSFNPQILFGLLHRENNLEDLKSVNNISHFLNKIQNLTNSDEQLKAQNVVKSKIKSVPNSLDFEHFKNYVDEKFLEMKKEILRHLEIKLEEIRKESNTKLDKIVYLLESSKL